ncbi:MAG: 30S ribosomal protein S12 methylthiotransferase RimO [Gammaproteobacteria bacterium]|nr:MAG: 30S ribosomal protein S12 methylthiotransferase RimO [Gammaproteobacteria bacterium]
MKNRIGYASLGCPKATVDSEKIITLLGKSGYQFVGDYAEADLVIVYTCGFISEAQQESFEVITEALNENGRIIVSGCLGAKEELIKEQFPQVLGITGPNDPNGVLRLVQQHLPLASIPEAGIVLPPQGLKLTPSHYSYLKISEGCNHNCSFCVIPQFRGRLISEKPETILAEAERLVESGVNEIIVVSQDTGAYGSDLKGYVGDWRGAKAAADIAALAERLSELPVWIRIHYLYPYPHIDKLVELMAEGKILPYLDVPFQHADSEILKHMKRPASGEDNLQRIAGWRSICPDITIRSTFIVGFPGETEDQFEQLLEFIYEADMDRAGCFAYSPVDGADANNLPDQIDEDEKQERVERFMNLQESISREKLRCKVGQQLEVIVDDVVDGQLVGRSYADAPEIDGLVYVKNSNGHINCGEIIKVTVTDSSEHDLWGAPVI